MGIGEREVEDGKGERDKRKCDEEEGRGEGRIREQRRIRREERRGEVVMEEEECEEGKKGLE